ncbi:MAG: putative secreted protein [Acidimicrobiales bacterium]|nr:putative secreted protein [Acidimicrobiales bacterium]
MGQRRRIIAGAALAVASLGALPLLAGASAGSPAGSAGRSGTKALDDTVHLNEIQTIGSHNSYHQVPTGKEYDLRHQFLGDADQALMYQADPLAMQFQNDKVRQIELDAWLDDAGGRYSDPLLRKLAGNGPYDPVMDQPGIKVFHVQDVDYHSSCLTLVACLQQVKTWSDAHPTHVPISILMELKDDELHVGTLPIVLPEPWTTAGMDTLDTEIRSVFSPGDLITPDDIRGSHSTLEEAVTTDGWPTLADSRGKVMFLMDNGGAKRTSYLNGHPSLAGRVLFTNANPGDDDAAFIERNDPTDASIPTLVQDGYVVRSRADEPTQTARDNDTTMRDQALASGAQWVSTDYPRPGMAIGFTSPYFAEIPGGTVARCNPVNGPVGCESAQLDTNYTPYVPPPTPTTTPPTEVTTTTAPSESVEPAGGATPVSGTSTFTG